MDARERAARASWDMTLEELEGTEWARKFKEDSPVSYAQALRYAQSRDLRVYVHKTNETGEVQWAISVLDEDSSDDFWMDAMQTKKEALELCRHMGWKVSR